MCHTSVPRAVGSHISHICIPPIGAVLHNHWFWTALEHSQGQGGAGDSTSSCLRTYSKSPVHSTSSLRCWGSTWSSHLPWDFAVTTQNYSIIHPRLTLFPQMTLVIFTCHSLHIRKYHRAGERSQRRECLSLKHRTRGQTLEPEWKG